MSSTANSQNALLIGATGLVGKQLFPLLLESPSFSTVGEYGRRVTSLPSENPKLIQRVVDFDSLENAKLKEPAWDVVFITMGTTKKIAGSKAAFTKIDKEYVVNAAREARVPGMKQRLVYLSSVGANSWSPIFYSRSKGQTEAELAAIGYDDFVVLRPGMFDEPDRSGTSRAGEKLPAIAETIGRWVAPLIKTGDIAKTLLAAGTVGSKDIPVEAGATSYAKQDPPRPYTVVENAGLLAWVKNL